MSLERVGVVLPLSASLLGCLIAVGLLRLELCLSGVLNSRCLPEDKKERQVRSRIASLVPCQQYITYKFEPGHRPRSVSCQEELYLWLHTARASLKPLWIA